MDEVPVHISFLNEETEAPEIMDLTLEPETFWDCQGYTYINDIDGENGYCRLPSAGSILQTLKTNCTPKGDEDMPHWPYESVGPLKLDSEDNFVSSGSIPAVPRDNSLGCLTDEHKELLKRLFVEGKKGSVDLDNSGHQPSSGQVDYPTDPERFHEAEEAQDHQQNQDPGKTTSSNDIASIMPISPFVGKCPVPGPPSALSPSNGVQLSPIFSQVDLGSLLNVISPLSSMQSSDLLELTSPMSQAGGGQYTDAVQFEQMHEGMEVDEWPYVGH